MEKSKTDTAELGIPSNSQLEGTPSSRKGIEAQGQSWATDTCAVRDKEPGVSCAPGSLVAMAAAKHDLATPPFPAHTRNDITEHKGNRADALKRQPGEWTTRQGSYHHPPP